jgi:hypothetical protein
VPPNNRMQRTVLRAAADEAFNEHLSLKQPLENKQ